MVKIEMYSLFFILKPRQSKKNHMGVLGLNFNRTLKLQYVALC